MTIAEKLQTIIDIKSDIKGAIVEKGVSVADTDSFASYADKIKSIETEGGSGSTGDDESLFIQYIEGTVTDLVIPNGTTKIRDYAFYYYKSLISVTIPDTVTSIGESAFNTCSSLTSITIPNGVRSIENDTFGYCSSLTSATIPDSVTSIETNAFTNCSALISITIPNSVTSLGSSVFYSCSTLTSITIPDSVTSIGMTCFRSCTNLRKVWLPSTVTTISASNSSSSILFSSNLRCVIYTDVACEDDIPEGWGTYWNYYDSDAPLEVRYGCDYSDFTDDNSRYDLFPEFSGYTEGDYTISASSEYSSSYPAWKAFDGADTTYWRSKNAPTEDDPQWIEIACGQSTTLSKLKLYFSSTSYMATDFVVQGSVDGEDWRDLATVTGNTYTLVTLNVDDSEAWKYFRIYFTGCNGSAMRLYEVWAGE